MALDYGRLFLVEELRLDGSNFAKWYLLLRNVLHTNDLLHVLDELIGDKPDASASEEDHMEWLEHQGTYLLVEWLMCNFINYGLSRRF